MDTPTSMAKPIKKFMPNTCDLCSSGIGKSLYYTQGTWYIHTHLTVLPHRVRISSVTANMCLDCYERFMEDQVKYRKILFNKLKDSK